MRTLGANWTWWVVAALLLVVPGHALHAQTYSISGTVFEDVNYGGGAGRARSSAAGWAPASNGSNRATVELYDGSGAFLAMTQAAADGSYTFANRAPGSYQVRLVAQTAPSSRSGWVNSLRPVLTYRTDASSGTSATDVTDRVGGEDPMLADTTANSGTQTLAQLTSANARPQAVAPVTLSASDITGVDFGVHFTTVTSTRDGGNGSLRQAITNANTLGGDASLATAGRASAIEHVVFMLPNGATANGDATTGGKLALSGGLRSALNAFTTTAGSRTLATITTGTSLPNITAPLTLDAQTQPGWTAGTNAPAVELNGNATASVGVFLASSGVTVRGFVINRYVSNGVRVEFASSGIIAGNWIGLNAAGTAAEANGHLGILLTATGTVGGITIGGTATIDRNVVAGNSTVFGGPSAQIYDGSTGGGNSILGNWVGMNAAGTAAITGTALHGITMLSPNTTVGGTVAGAGNVVSGVSNSGIWIEPGATNARVQGNIIGLTPDGLTALPNGTGVTVSSASGVQIGGTATGARNVISGNSGDGIVLNARGVTVQGNYLGTTVNGDAARANANGILVSAAQAVIGGTTTAARNVISGNSQGGIRISADSATVQGNYIGIAVNGSAALANGAAGAANGGVWIISGTSTMIGGANANARNVISGNGGAGVWLDGGTFTQILSNYIGTDASGLNAAGNGRWGVVVNSTTATNTTIGAAGAGNVISGNSTGGIISFANALTVQGNLIGPSADQSANLGNATTGGIWIRQGTGVVIGGTTAGRGNVIAGNSGWGVVVTNSPGVAQAAIRGNSIYGNTNIGIDLGGDGATGPSASTTSGQPNQLMSRPTITRAVLGASTLSVVGYVGNAPLLTTFGGSLVDVYISDASSTAGSGRMYVGTLTANIDGEFAGVLSTSGLSGLVAGTTQVTATATDGSGNTSEFGANVTTVALAAFVNGGFETPSSGSALTVLLTGSTSMPGWTVTGYSIDINPNSIVAGYWTATEGTQSIDLTGSDRGGLLQFSQTIPGQTYTALFDLTANALQACYSSPKQGRVTIGGVPTSLSVPIGSTNASPAWTTLSIPFTASAEATAIWFEGFDRTCAGLVLDNVRLVDGPVYAISGTIFEDVNYGGGAGRPRSNATGWAAASNGSSRATVELYDGSGNFLATTQAAADGSYAFVGRQAGSYQVRAVLQTAPSSRTGWANTLRPVLTYRTDASSGTATGVTDRVGGEDPTLPDTTANSGTQTLAQLTSATARPQALAPVTLGASDITGVDFGIHFTTVTNTLNSGGGSLRQAITNASTLGGDASLTTAGRTSGVEHVVFMLPNGATANGDATTGGSLSLSGGLRSAFNAFTTTAGSRTVATIAPLTALPILSAPVRIDARTQPGWTTAPVIELRGNAGSVATAFTLQNGSGGSLLGGFVINRFISHAISLDLSASSVIAGNWIGLDATGTVASANGGRGLSVANTGSAVIGGTTAADRNVISGNTGDGVYLSSSTGTALRGNFIGTDITGNAAVANGNNGVTLATNAVVVGGASSAQRNVISGNTGSGISTTGSNGSIVGNYIGVGADGSTPLGNGSSGANTAGVVINGGALWTIGGTTAGAGNVISANRGNTAAGLQLLGVTNSSTEPVSNAVYGNLIGTDATGTVVLGNQGIGVLANNATRTAIGAANGANVIAGSAGAGVSITGTSTVRVSRNSLRANGGIGVDLGGNGVTANDGTTTTGQPNVLIDHPVFTTAFLSGTSLTVSGYVGSAPGQSTFAGALVEVFVSDNDGTGFGEGQTFVDTVYTNASGGFTKTFTGVSGITAGTTRITGTVTDASNNTSEFGANALVQTITPRYWVASGPGNWSNAANWSATSGGAGGAGVPGPLNDVIFDGGGLGNATVDGSTDITVNTWTQTAAYPGTVTFQTTYAGGLQSVSITGDATVNGGTWTHTANGATQTYRLNVITGGAFTLGSGATIDVGGRGYAEGSGPGAGTAAYQGASHGGRGVGAGTGGFGAVAPTYGSFTAPVDLGSGGVARLGGSRGGGAVRLAVSGAASLSGTITAAGACDSEFTSCGAGGSIWVTAGTVSGSGTLRADGGSSGFTAPSGGGGRVAVHLTSGTTFGGLVTRAFGGGSAPAAGVTIAAAAGTVYLQTSTDPTGGGQLIIDNNNQPMAAPVYTSVPSGQTWSPTQVITRNGGVLSVESGATLNLASATISGVVGTGRNGIRVAGGTLVLPASLTISNWWLYVDGSYSASGTWVLSTNGGITHSAATSASALFAADLTLNGNLTVASGGAVDVTARGYPALTGPGAQLGFNTRIVGSHGGQASSSGLTYGDPMSPLTQGSGSQTRAGGGAIRLTVTGTTQVDASVTANGAGAFNSGGGSAGGSIWLTTGALTGGGSITANGGSDGNHGGGGGGRVAVVLTGPGSTFPATPTISARGGSGAPSATAVAAGTVYLQTTAQGAGGGQLIVDNGGSSSPATFLTTLDDATARSVVVGSVVVRNAGRLQIGSDDAITTTASGTTLTVASGATLTNLGVLSISGTAPSIAGTASFGTAGNTVTYTGQADNTGVTLAPGPYHHLTVNRNGTTFTQPAAALNVGGNLTISAGTFASGGQNLNVAGNWSNSGTYTPGSNTVALTGVGGSTQTISGSTTFTNLTATTTTLRTLRFAAGSTTTVTGVLTLQGASGQLLALRSSTPGSTWNLAPSATAANRGVSFVDVQDGVNLTAPVLNPAGSVDSGNNTLWFANLSIAGTIFEDVNYGGGAGRPRSAATGWAPASNGASRATVELYDGSGAFVASTQAAADGTYSFTNLSQGSYQVRAVLQTAPSSRTGWVNTLRPVLTYRTDASSGTIAVDVTDRVGGEDPMLADTTANAGTQTLAQLTSASARPQAVAPVTLSTGAISGVDFGVHFTTVTNTRDVAAGSLRQAIINANTLGGDASLATVGRAAAIEHVVLMIPNGATATGDVTTGGKLALSGGLRSAFNAFTTTAGSRTVATITPATQLPAMDTPMIVDAQTQPGWLGTTAAPVLEITRNNAAAAGMPIWIRSSGVTVRGFVLNRAADNAVRIETATSGTIAGNWIGVNAAGSAAAANTGSGVQLASGVSGIVIGGTTLADRNVIAGNATHGVSLMSATNAQVFGNYIGTLPDGATAAANAQHGVNIENGSGHQIGGATAGQGNVISGNGTTTTQLAGVLVSGTASNVAIAGNLIGIGADGQTAVANTGTGVYVTGGTGIMIGGATSAHRNVISGNLYEGVYVVGAGTVVTVQNNLIGLAADGSTVRANTFDGVVNWNDNSNLTIIGNTISGNSRWGIALPTGSGHVIRGNRIGTDATGTVARPNVQGGINIQQWAGGGGAPSGIVIGGTNAGEGNLISGNAGFGVQVAVGTGTQLIGNVIGLNAAGTAALANPVGVVVSNVTGTVIGGTSAAARNVISGNTTFGIDVQGTTATGTLIQNNYIGLDSTGTTRIANQSTNVVVRATGVSVGTPGAGNVILGGNANPASAIDILSTATGTIVQGNTIGLAADRTTALTNGWDGIQVRATGVQIGGTASNAGNVIGGLNSAASGIAILTGANNFVIEGNTIGQNATATAARPNGHGIWVQTGTVGGRIGGVAAGAANVIAGNALTGVTVMGTSRNVTISRNTIRGNTGLGIDLSSTNTNGDGVTTNDGATTTGQPNLLLDQPVITSATVNGTTLTVTGYVGSAANQGTFANALVELFVSDNDGTGFGQGQTFIDTVYTNASGGFTKTFTGLSGLVAGTTRITGTATDAAGNTSEFGANTVVIGALADVVTTLSGPSTSFTNTATPYTVTVRNTGPVTSTGIVPVVTLPSGVTVTDAGGATLAGQSLTWPTVASLAAGDSAQFTFSTTAAATGTYLYSVASTAGVTDPVPANNDGSAAAARVSTLLRAGADLVVSSRTTPPFVVGSNATLVRRVANVGDTVTTSGVTLTDSLPTGVTYVGSTPAAGWTCALNGSAVQCSGPPLVAADSAIIQHTVSLGAPAAPQARIASRVSTTGDVVAANDTISDLLALTSRHDLQVALAVPPFAQPGSIVRDTITITNLGPSPADSVQVQVTASPRLSIVGVTGACTAMPCTLGTIAPSAQQVTIVSWSVPMDYLTPDPMLFTARVVPQAGSVDPVATNDTTSATVSLDAGTVIGIVFNDLDGNAARGGAEPGLSGIQVLVQTVRGDTLRTTTTTDGSWQVTGVPSGAAVVTVLDSTAGRGFVRTTATGATTVTVVRGVTVSAAGVGLQYRSDIVATLTGPVAGASGTALPAYRLVVQNRGPGDAADVMATATVPAPMALVSASNGGALAGTTLAWPSLPTLAAGDSAAFTFVVQSNAPGSYTLSAAATSATADPIPANNNGSAPLARVTTLLTGGVDIAVSRTLPASFVIGQPASIVRTVRNVGVAPTVAPVVLTDSLPNGLSFVSATGPAWTCSAVNRVVTCTLPSHAPGDSSSVTMVTRLSSAAWPRTALWAGTQTTADVNLANNIATDSITISSGVDLVLRSRIDSALVVGRATTLRHVISNGGTGASIGPITVVDTLPAGLSYRSVTGTGWTCGATGTVLSCTRPDSLVPGDSTSLALRLDVARAAMPSVTVRSQVSTLDEAVLSNNVSSVRASVSADYVLFAEVTAQRSTAEIGDPVDFTGTIKVVGESPVPGVTAVIALPRGFRYQAGSLFISGATPPVQARVSQGAPSIMLGGAVLGNEPELLPDGSMRVALGDIAAAGSVTMRWRVRLGPGSQRSGGTTRLQAVSTVASSASNTSTALVRVRGGVFSDRGIIFGKVFLDCACDESGRATQETHEVGVPGVRLILEDGTSVITDAEGKYSLPGLRPLLHVVRIDPTSLPEGAELVITGNRNAGNAASRFVDLTNGEFQKADFALARRDGVLQAVRARRIAALRSGGALEATPVGFASRASGLTDVQLGALPNAPAGPTSFGDSALIKGFGDTRNETLRGDTAAAAGAGTGAPQGGRVSPKPKPEMSALSPNYTAPAFGSRDSAVVTGPGVLTWVPKRFVATGLLQGRLELRRFGGSGARLDDGFDAVLRGISRRSIDSTYRTGMRTAFYASGDIAEQTRLTLAFDSERDAELDLLRDIDPDNEYAVFGDASVREFDARSAGGLSRTAGRGFARLDRGRSTWLLGDFTAPPSDDARRLSAYDRTLTGLRQHLELGSKALGASVDAFLSRTTLAQRVEELPGEGVSGPYQLRRSDVRANSERVEIIVRDRNQPAVVISRTTLGRFTDYTLERDAGRIVFRAPVPSVDAELNPVSVRVSYEVETGGDPYTSYGADARVRAGALTVGAAAVRDDNPLAPREVLGVHGALSLGRGTTLIGEVARSNGAATSNTTGTTQDADTTRRVGDAVRLEFRHQSRMVGLRLSGVITSATFANPSAMTPAGRTEVGGNGSVTLTQHTRLLLQMLRTEDRLTGGRRDGALASVEQQFGKRIRLELGGRWASENRSPVRTDSVATAPLLQPNSLSALRSKVTVDLLRGTRFRSSIAGEFEQDVRQRDQQRAALSGDLGLARGARLYARHELLTSASGPFGVGTASRQAATVVGLTADVRSNQQVFNEYRLRDGISGRQAEAAFGLRNRWRVDSGVVLNTSFERVAPVSDTTSSNRTTAITGGFEFSRWAATRATARAEYRRATGGDSWLGSLALAQQVMRGVTFLGRGVYTTAPTQQRLRAQLGLALRPVDSDVWNALLRLDERDEATSPVGQPKLTSAARVLSLHLNTQPDPRLTLSTRYAFKRGTEQGVVGSGVLQTRATTQLLSGRALYDLTTHWDMALQGSVLGDAGFGSRQTGLGLTIGRRVLRDLRVAAGYNLFGWTDADLAGSGASARGLVIDFGFKFDETSFRGAR